MKRWLASRRLAEKAGRVEIVTPFYRWDTNLLKRKSVAGPSTTPTEIETSYGYDVLNRNTTVSYTGSATLSVNRYYDGQPPYTPSGFDRGKSVGRLVAVTYGSGSTAGTYYGYDELGRVKQSIQRSDLSQDYGFSYMYDLAGNLTEQTYPSLRKIVTSYDAAGRISNVKRDAALWNYAEQFGYTAHGALEKFKLGNGLWEQMSFNNRLQVTQIGLGAAVGDTSKLQLTYNYGTSNNNGNVLSQTINIAANNAVVPPQPALNVTQNYGYDALNRLTSAGEGSNWSQSYSYDRFGNRAVTGYTYLPNPNLTPQFLTQYDTATNRLWDNSHYDAAGNQTSDTIGRMFSYDAENRLVSSTPSNVVYSYDGEGRRVKKLSSSVTTVFVYNAQGQLIAEYTSSAPAYGIGGTKYLTADHLGSTRLVTSGGRGDVKARYDYLPFGEELGSSFGVRGSIAGYGVADSTRQKFGSKERDGETGLDYFGARYFASMHGRFTSVDPENYQALDDLTDPQSWNAYSYVNNNPLRRTDPDGRGFQEKFKNWYKYGVWGTEEDVKAEEEKRRKELEKAEAEAQKAAREQGGFVEVTVGGKKIKDLTRDEVFAASDNLRKGNINVAVGVPIPNPLLSVNKAINSEISHAADQAASRQIFPDKKTAAEALRKLSSEITQNGWPPGSILDTKYADRVLVPIGKGGYAVYQVLKNGTARLKTVLIGK